MAVWNGQGWAALGDGIPSVFGVSTIGEALTTYDDGLGGGPSLMVGGRGFRMSGEVPAVNIARWGCSPCDAKAIKVDCNRNGIDDGCEIATQTVEDCDGNMVPDACDIAQGSSIDCNSNGVLDDCEPTVTSLNETCALGTLVLPGSYTIDTRAAVSDPTIGIATCGGGDVNMNRDVWFRAVIQCSGVVTFSLCDSCFDAKLAVYTTCPGAATAPVACSDDYCGWSPRVAVVNTASTLYRVRVGSAGQLGGHGTLIISCETCPADIAPPSGNNIVNVDDLLAVIGAWGPCADPGQCPADIFPVGGDQLVNVDDLLAMIGAWGPCP